MTEAAGHLPGHGPETPVAVNVFVETRRVYATELNGPLELGRQRPGEAPPYTRVDNRLIIATLEESHVSRRHVLLEPIGEGRVRITNQSSVNTIVLGGGDHVQPAQQRDVHPPALLTLGNRAIQIEPKRPPDAAAEALESFLHQTTAPGQAPPDATSLAGLLAGQRSNEDTEYLLRGLHATIGVLQLASNSSDFLTMAAQAMIDVVGLETAAALLWQDGQWRVAALCRRPGDDAAGRSAWEPSSTILQRVRDQRKTFWQVPDGNAVASLIDVKALVAAPILNRQAEVVGALYGDRRRDASGRAQLHISEVEAILVELLSTSVAAGLARLEQEHAAVAARVLFEQFFTPELSRQLEAQPDLLLGKDTQVTLLCCDIRRFSRVSEQLGPRLTIDWIHDVMETLSGCVAQQHGVLVDTLGDKLTGMWGAPLEREDHAPRACQAALAMFRQLPDLNRRWQDALDRPMDLGIGIHTGMARVGNIGSTRKFKYGPLGSSVALTGRIEAATAALRAKVLISGATAALLDDRFATRRLCRLDEEDLETPVELFELAADVPDDWPEMKQRYEAALDAYDRDDLPTATRLLAKILADHPGDRASLRLLARIDDRLSQRR